MSLRYPIPPNIAAQGLTQATYEHWLRRKAEAHKKRDRLRAAHPITGEGYRRAIHGAVEAQGAHDFYTGEALDWSLVSTYDNAKSKSGGSAYKAKFALLPTVDHVALADGSWDFVICAWRTNAAKADLSHAEFLALCRRVLDHSGLHDL